MAILLASFHRTYSRLSRTRSCVQLQHKHAFSLACWNPLTCARVLEVRFLRSEHDDVSFVNNLTPGGQQNFWRQRPRTFILHVLPSRTKFNLASSSTRVGLLFAAASLTVFVARVLVTPFFRIGHTLVAAPESVVIFTMSCTTSTALSDQIQNVEFVASTRDLHEFYCSHHVNLHESIEPVTSTVTNKIVRLMYGFSAMTRFYQPVFIVRGSRFATHVLLSPGAGGSTVLIAWARPSLDRIVESTNFMVEPI